MLIFFLTSIQLLIAIYWTGDLIRKNKKIDVLIYELENNYRIINQRLIDAQVKNSLEFLRKIFGWISFLMVLICVSLSLTNVSYIIVSISGVIGLYFSSSWLANKWYFEHKNIISSNLGFTALIVSSPIIAGIVELYTNIEFLTLQMIPISELIQLVDLQIPTIKSPIVLGFYISLFVSFVYLGIYLMVWILATPLVFVSILMVVLPSLFAKLVNKIVPSNSFFGLSVVIMIMVTFAKESF